MKQILITAYVVMYNSPTLHFNNIIVVQSYNNNNMIPT